MLVKKEMQTRTMGQQLNIVCLLIYKQATYIYVSLLFLKTIMQWMDNIGYICTLFDDFTVSVRYLGNIYEKLSNMHESQIWTNLWI